MPPPQIPSPIITGGGRQRRPGIGEILLTSLARSLPQALAYSLFRDQGEPSVAEQQLTGQQEAASGTLVDQARQGSQEAQTALQRGGFNAAALGNANVPTSQVAGDLRSFQQQAPALMQQAQQEQAARMKAEALQDARGYLANIAEEGNENQLLGAFDFMTAASSAGMDTSLIKEALPPGEKEKVDLAEARLNLRTAQNEASADQFATGWLQQQGIIPEGAPTIPGAGQTLLSVTEAREGEAINWTQEGVDFILGRIGESGAGTGATIVPGQTITAQDFLRGDEAVSVEQAIGEWKSFVERYAPPEVAQKEIKRIESGAFQRLLTKDAAIQETIRIFKQSPDIDPALIRESLSGGFSKKEINEIIRAAKRRSDPALVR